MNIDKLDLDCSCHDFGCTVRLTRYNDEDSVFLTTHFKQHGLFKRLWHAAKYVFGLNFILSETVLVKESITSLRNFCDKFLDYDMVPVGNRDIFNWMLKYDKEYKGNPREVLYALIAAGAEHLYMEGLKNAEPLLQEVVDAITGKV